MFRARTLFIVGAGASFELDLPTGEDLKSSLSTLLNITFPDGWTQTTGDHQIAELLKRCAGEAGNSDWNYLLYKCWLIRDALPGALSIDNVLDAHAGDPDLVYCGKLAIDKAVLQAERRSRLFHDGASEDRRTVFQRAAGTWLIPFFQILTENVKKEDIHQIFANIDIITFNYDRCIEHFLSPALQSYYGINEQKADAHASNAVIIHPYGQVGALNRHSGAFYASFGADRCDLASIAKGIRTFSEGLSDEQLATRIEVACKEAEQIVFLGFAFHPLNMQILAAKTDCAARKIFGTTLGLSDAARKVVKATILDSFNKNDPSLTDIGTPDVRDLDEINLDSIEASRFLISHFRGIA